VAVALAVALAVAVAVAVAVSVEYLGISSERKDSWRFTGGSVRACFGPSWLVVVDLAPMRVRLNC